VTGGGPATGVLTCPACGVESREAMPTDACLHSWSCPACRVMLRPRPGDCCVFCSYGDRCCPPRQEEDAPGG